MGYDPYAGEDEVQNQVSEALQGGLMGRQLISPRSESRLCILK